MHKHLTWTERLKIEKGLKEGLKPCAIANRLHVHNTTVYRELKRGTNENINKMIWRFLSKGTDFRKVTAEYIKRVEEWINNYPREILGFETSGSLFERYVAEAA